MDKVTLVITCCRRPQLLQKTLQSFLKYNTYPIEEAILIEDSELMGINDFAKSILPFPTTCLYNGKNIGQIESIDVAYANVKTPYIFHCEDDWEFFYRGFIEASLRVLKTDPLVVVVQLRAHNDTNGHPVELHKNLGGYYYMSNTYDALWHGFTLNPGLRRTVDYLLVKPFVESCKPYMEGFGHPNEPDLSRIYNNLGYRGSILQKATGYVRHIGANNHIPRVWDTSGVGNYIR